MSELNSILPPNSVEAERSVLGAMLQDPEAVSQAVEHLTGEDFYQPAHREIFDSMFALNNQQQPIDLVTVDAELSRRGTLKGVGDTGYLMELVQYVPTTANVKAYIAIVNEKSTLRRLIKASQEIAQECQAQLTPLQDVLAHAEKSIFDIVMRRAGGESLQPMSEVLLKTYERIETLARLKGENSGVPTGFIDLDNTLTGLHEGELILIGARPSMGKTSFAANVAAYAGLFAGKKVAFFSLEMPREQIAMRMLCSDARVDMQRVRKGRLTTDDWMKLAESTGPLSRAGIYIDDTAALTPSMLRTRLRRMMMDHGLDLAVVDYLGLMKADGKTENRQLEVSEICRQLKAIALDLKIPLIACAQLSRASVSRQDKRPILSDLRDSGSIEQDADVVLFLHREGYYTKADKDKNLGEIIIAKQRNGPLDTINVAWLPEYTTYANLAHSRSEQAF
ncbi:MAG: replicative DNA helicase [Clostridia bacterium]|nr:replicative DNA helicase [Clostridia bacterium]